LLVDQSKEDIVLGAVPGDYVRPNPTAVEHRSLKGIWWLAEFLPRKYYDKTLNLSPWIIPRGQRRNMPENSLIHSSTFERMKQVRSYDPPNLPRSYRAIS
jgi:hypothetical protein